MCFDTQIRLEAKAVDDGEEAVYAIEGCSSDGAIGQDVASASCEHIVYLHVRVFWPGD